MPLNETVTRDADGSLTRSVDWVAPSSHDSFAEKSFQARQFTHDFKTTEQDNIKNGIAPMTPREFRDQNHEGYIARTSGLPPEFGSMEQAVAWYRDNQIAVPQVQDLQVANEIARGVSTDLAGNVADTRQSMLERGFTGKLPLPGDNDVMEYATRALKHKLIEDADPELAPSERIADADNQIASIDQEMLLNSIRSDLDLDNPYRDAERGLDNYFGMMGLDSHGPEANWICEQAAALIDMGYGVAESLDGAYQTWANPSSDVDAFLPPDEDTDPYGMLPLQQSLENFA